MTAFSATRHDRSVWLARGAVVCTLALSGLVPGAAGAIVGAPSAPRSLTVAAGPAIGQAALQWVAPASSGTSAVTDYGAAVLQVGSTAWSPITWFASTTLSAAISGSSPLACSTATPGSTGCRYRVSARNSIGASAASSAVLVWNSPAAPTSVSAAFTSETSALVTWLAPINNGGFGAALQYQVWSKFDAATTWTLVTTTSATSASVACTGLSSCAYKVNAIFTPSDAPSLVFTGAATAAAALRSTPNAPGPVSIAVASNDRGTGVAVTHVTWTAPLAGSPSSLFQWQRCSIATGFLTGCASTSTTWSASTSTTNATINDACGPNAATCYYRVRAVRVVNSSVSIGPWRVNSVSPWSPFSIALVPGPGLGEVSVTFAGPSETGNAGTGNKHYTVATCSATCSSDAHWVNTGLSIPSPVVGGPFSFACSANTTCNVRVTYFDGTGASSVVSASASGLGSALDIITPSNNALTNDRDISGDCTIGSGDVSIALSPVTANSPYTASCTSTGIWSVHVVDADDTYTATATQPSPSLSSASVAFTLDTTAPSTPSTPDLDAASDLGSSSTDDITSDNTPTFTGTADANATVRLYDGATLLGTVVATAGTYSITSPILGDGTHTISATATDTASNTSVQSSGLTITIDTSNIAPSTPDLLAASDSGASSSDNITNVDTPTFVGTAEIGSTVTIYNGTTLIGTGFATGGSYSIVASSLGDGTAAITAQSVDTGGNVSPLSGSLSVTIDTVIATPSTPDLTAATDSGSSNTDDITNDSAPAFTGSAEAGSTVALYDSSTALSSGVASSGTYSLVSTTLTDGTHAFKVRATDTAGNVSAYSATRSVVIDTIAPVVTTTTPTDGSYTNASAPAFAGTCTTGDGVVTLNITNTTTTTVTTSCTASAWATSVFGLNDATYGFNAQQTDLAGNTGISATNYVTIDTVAPTAPSTPDLIAANDSGTSSTDNITNINTPTFNGTAESGTTVVIYDGTTAIGSGTATGGSYSITVTALGDGTHSITAKSFDSASNVSPPSPALSVTIDTVITTPSQPDLTAATDSGTSSSDNVTKIVTPSFAGTAESGSTVTIYDGATLSGTSTAAAGNYTITAGTLSEGSHTMKVRAVDVAGNVSAYSGTSTIVIDTIAPIVTTTAPTDGSYTNSATPTFTGTCATGDGVVTLSLVNGSTTNFTTACTAAAWSTGASGLADATYGFFARQTDLAGNTGTSATSHVTIDTVAPPAPSTPDLATASDSGSSSTDDITSVTTPLFTGTAEAASTVKLYDGAVLIGTGIATGGNYSITVSALSDGAHSITAKSTDSANNVSPPSPALIVTIDTAIATPSAPDLTAATDSGASNTDNVTNVNTPTFTGTAEAGSTVTLYDGATLVGSGIATAGSYSLTSSTLTNGSHTIKVRATDAAGNVSSFSTTLTVVIDTIAPVVTTTAPTDFSYTNSSAPSFAGACTAGDGAVSLVLTSATTTTVTTSCTAATWTTSVAGLADGAYSFVARQTDLAGNIGTSATSHVTIDTVAPNAPSTPDLTAATDTGSSNTDNNTSVNTPTFTGTAEAGSTVTIYDGVTLIGTGTATGGNYSITVSTLTDGSHTITAKSTDVATNVSAPSSSLTVTIDTATPSAPSAPDLTAATDSGTSNTDNNTSVNTPTFTGTAEAGSTVTIYDGATLIGTGTATGGNYSITVSTLTDGSHTITAKSTDTAGNTSTTSASLTITNDTTTPTFAISVTGANVITTGTTVFYKPGGTGSFSVTTSDTGSGFGTTAFPNAPSGWTKSGTNPSTYTLGAASASLNLSGFTGTDIAGNTAALTVTITADSTGPTSSYSLSAPTGATIIGTTLYFKNNASGSFVLVNTASDAGAGVVSTAYPAVATASWTHNAQTVSTPTGGPFSSTTYSWISGAATPASGPTTFVATDAVGNTTTTVFTFINDTTAPTAPTITFPANGASYNAAAWAAGCSASVCGADSDAGSGVATVNLTIKRLSDNLFWSGSAWGASSTLSAALPSSTTWSQALAASALTNGISYTVTVTSVVDRLGNTQSTTAASTFTYDTSAPTLAITGLASGGGSSKVTVNGTGSSGANDGTVTVYLCHVTSCGSANATDTATVTVSAGTWTYSSGNIGGGTYYATATRTDTAGNTTTVTDFGPFVR